MKPAKSILLIDDDSNVLRGLTRQLTADGYEVLSAVSAAEAHVFLERTVVDVLICDNRMPGMSGLEFLGAIKHRYPTTKRIILSGSVCVTQAFQAQASYGVDHVLPKPCDFKALREAIEEVTAGSA